MIKIESAHIVEVRGIRKLDLDFRRDKFAISGPNGSGKSGVIDAIEFALTGRIGRLSGIGTKGLSVAEHGPHVDLAKSSEGAYVELTIFLPDLGKTAKIKRKLSAPKTAKIEPNDDDVKKVLAEIANHPEITLSRREILRFILAEPTKRSDEIQAILKLDQLGDTRTALNAAHNKLRRSADTEKAQLESKRTSLLTHLQISSLKSELLVESVNQRRKVLGLPAITELNADVTLTSGLAQSSMPVAFNKESALRDVKALADACEKFSTLAGDEVGSILKALSELEDDPALFIALQRRSFIEMGLGFIDGAECPLCDLSWEDEEQLRNHLQVKLEKSVVAKKLQQSLQTSGSVMVKELIKVLGLITPIQQLADANGENRFAQSLGAWKTDLEALKTKLQTIEGLVAMKERLSAGWLEPPTTLSKDLTALARKINDKPDQSATVAAQTFLTTAQIRLDDYRTAKRKYKESEIARRVAQTAYETYCSVLEEELNALYNEVEQDFSSFYRAINGDDEATFTAKLTPSEGKLDLSVNFYERGLFPPGAYHSEGHQDGMGVCLYLALMKRLLGEHFTLALLDDVVMSVDTGHRYQFCKLLKTQFPNTQFIITTHDRLWAEQMKSAGLVTKKTSIAFRSWTVETGPLVESNEEIWDEIDTALTKDKIKVAAAALRHHLEYVLRHLAEELGASPQFRSDGNYELGDLLPSVITRVKELYGKGADAAQSWGNDGEKEAIGKRKSRLSNASSASDVERWAVNRAVHYNEWANFGKADFKPVVAAFKELLECFRCDVCASWIAAAPRSSPQILRCDCNAININLKHKLKSK
jgi:recombinational DNA repair ATPase RecF